MWMQEFQIFASFLNSLRAQLCFKYECRCESAEMLSFVSLLREYKTFLNIFNISGKVEELQRMKYRCDHQGIKHNSRRSSS